MKMTMKHTQKNNFLPVCREDMEHRGWESVDFVFVTGDAYVDHPSFAAAILSRVLEDAGFKVAILAQPDIQDENAFKIFGRPRLGFMVSAGNIDSMVAHYTAAKRKRSEDMFSPGGKAGKRPDRATINYCNKIRRAYGSVPIIIGGIEASLRRFAHYDYWDDKVRRPILFDSGADLLIYGMGERTIVEVANYLNDGFDPSMLTFIDGTAYIAKDTDSISDFEMCPSFDEVKTDKTKYARSVKIQFDENDPIRGKTVVQPCCGKFLIQNKPALPLTREELDHVFSLDFCREVHPMYNSLGGVPAINEVKFSIASSRGCFGGCSFCAIAFHQGRIVQSRSKESIVEEAKKLVKYPDFKGYIHDVGGPTANFRYPACKNQLEYGVCKNKQCLYPAPCKNLEVSHDEYLGIKKVFVRSGLRFDYIMADKDDTFFVELCRHHVSGQLKVAPEHISGNVLELMGKPGRDVYDSFCEKYYDINKKIGKEQYLVPYLMSSHPGSTLKSAIKLALYLKEHGLNPQQVQDFYPTPGTVSTCMYYTGIDIRTGKEVYVPRSYEEKQMQRALLQYKNPANYDLVEKALRLAGRSDLIGYDKKCLIKPRSAQNSKGRPKNISFKNKKKRSCF